MTRFSQIDWGQNGSCITNGQRCLLRSGGSFPVLGQVLVLTRTHQDSKDRPPAHFWIALCSSPWCSALQTAADLAHEFLTLVSNRARPGGLVWVPPSCPASWELCHSRNLGEAQGPSFPTFRYCLLCSIQNPLLRHAWLFQVEEYVFFLPRETEPSSPGCSSQRLRVYPWYFFPPCLPPPHRQFCVPRLLGVASSPVSLGRDPGPCALPSVASQLVL